MTLACRERARMIQPVMATRQNRTLHRGRAQGTIFRQSDFQALFAVSVPKTGDNTKGLKGKPKRGDY
jgi:hypothetical protein